MVLKSNCVHSLHLFMRIFIVYQRQEGFLLNELAKWILGEMLSAYLEGEEVGGCAARR